MHTTTRRLQVGDKVRSRNSGLGTVVPLADWPGQAPYHWSNDDTVVVRWDDLPDSPSVAGMEGFRFTPFMRVDAEEVLTLVEAAPQGDPADTGEDDGVHRSRFAPPTDAAAFDGGRIPQAEPQPDGGRDSAPFSQSGLMSMRGGAS